MRAHALVLAVSGVLLWGCSSFDPAPLDSEDMTVYFGSRSAALVASEREKVNRLVDVLGNSHEVTVTIIGYAGTPGDSSHLMHLLALERSLVVWNALVADLQKTNASRIRLAYRACGIGADEQPPHRVDIFVTDLAVEPPDPCVEDGDPSLEPPKDPTI